MEKKASEKLRERAGRVEELETAKEKVEDIIFALESLVLPKGINPSHHALLELGEVLFEIESKIEEES